MSDLLPWMAPWSGRVLTLGVFAFGLWLMWRGWRRRKRDAPHCPACDYNLTGSTSPSCPECGFTPTDEGHKFRGRRRWRLVLIGLLVAMSLPVYVVQRRVRVYGWEYYTYVGPIYWLSPTKTIEEQQVNGLTIRVIRDRRPMSLLYTFEIRRNHRVLYAGSDYRIKLGHTLWSDGEVTVTYVETYSGGAHCCETTDVLVFRGGIFEVYPIHGYHSSIVFTDLDGDGVPEVELNDWTFQYWNTSFADSPAPRVVLKWDGDRFNADPQLMRQPAPPDAELDSEAAAFRQRMLTEGDQFELWMRSGLWRRMLDLIYTGHADRAWDFFDDAWPDEHPGKDAFLTDFCLQLARSPYFAALVELNPGMLSPTPDPP